MPQIKTLPDRVEFSLPFSDNSGQRIKAIYMEHRKDILLEDVDKRIIVRGEDIEWLIGVLQDVKGLIQEREEKKSPECQNFGVPKSLMVVSELVNKGPLHLTKDGICNERLLCSSRRGASAKVFIGDHGKVDSTALCKRCLSIYNKAKEAGKPT